MVRPKNNDRVVTEARVVKGVYQSADLVINECCARQIRFHGVSPLLVLDNR